MPRLNVKQQILQSLELSITYNAFEASDSEDDSDLDDLVDIYIGVATSRYLNRPSHYNHDRNRDAIKKHREIHSQSELDFKREMRVYYHEFHSILELVKDHHAFEHRGGRRQAPVDVQLTMALWRFTHYGDAASTFQLGRTFGISGMKLLENCACVTHNITEGTVNLWTDRVMLALLSIEKTTVFWPDADERRKISEDFAHTWALPGGCVGIIDGFHVVLAYQPQRIDHHDFHSYKGADSFNVTGICDTQKRIRYLQCGFPGSSHDMRVFKASCMYNDRPAHFSDGEYLLADSAYTPDFNCVPLFKREPGKGRTAEEVNL
ncbi:nuclease HARBI1, partial [Tremellales sp. Uapishka_1]